MKKMKINHYTYPTIEFLNKFSPKDIHTVTSYLQIKAEVETFSGMQVTYLLDGTWMVYYKNHSCSICMKG